MDAFLPPIEKPASEHLYNLTNSGLNIHSGPLCDLSLKKTSNAQRPSPAEVPVCLAGVE